MDADPVDDRTKKPRGATNRRFLREAGEPDGLPDIPAHDVYMLAAFRACGVCKPGVAGAVPLEWPDLLAFADGTAQISRGDDIGLLHGMCHAYWSAHEVASRDALAEAPADRAQAAP